MMPPLPPPYVPPEHANKKLNEMPEPYRTQILEWIAATDRIMAARVNVLRFNYHMAIATVIGAGLAILIILIGVLSTP